MRRNLRAKEAVPDVNHFALLIQHAATPMPSTTSAIANPLPSAAQIPIWYTIARNRMTYNEQGKRTSLENLAGQVTTTAWDGWSVTYNGENRPVLWECVSTNSPTPNSSTHNSSTPTLLSMSYDRIGRRVTKNSQRFVYDGYLQIANFERASTNSQLTTHNCSSGIAMEPEVTTL